MKFIPKNKCNSTVFPSYWDVYKKLHGVNTTNHDCTVYQPAKCACPIFSFHIKQPTSLKPFGGREQEHTLPFSLLGYLKLVDWTGRYIHSKEKGYMSKDVPHVLASMKIEVTTWLDRVQNYGTRYGNFAGSETVLRVHAAKNDVNWYKGVG
ncbi:hypothetical protein [Pseudoalteromonas luteoviolacea]|uniref:hypothetical protein n=1 Tax=Pseudoalteromonas luteoviolacea TaxID=43657 RepID=UPI0007B0AB85|nr:hypothetical protein [Pseudoalteromonas luteoviolacea]KZN41163.1 hypothetical protein N483_16255 [Pseudoalteromonas luteoviolacea NCIMB 1944]